MSYTRKPQSKTILVVDNSDACITLFKEMFDSNIFSIQIARTGEEALLFFSNKKIDLIITELILPDIDGVDLVRKFTYTGSIPVLVVSSVCFRTQNNLARQAGCDAFIEKPFDVQQLILLVTNMLYQN